MYGVNSIVKIVNSIVMFSAAILCSSAILELFRRAAELRSLQRPNKAVKEHFNRNIIHAAASLGMHPD